MTSEQLGSRWWGYALALAIAVVGFQVGWAAAQGRLVAATAGGVAFILILIGGVGHAWRLIDLIADTARSRGLHEGLTSRSDAAHDRIDDPHPPES